MTIPWSIINLSFVPIFYIPIKLCIQNNILITTLINDLKQWVYLKLPKNNEQKLFYSIINSISQSLNKN